MKLTDIQTGDIVTRLLAGAIPHKLKVTKIDNELIHCGPWTFCRRLGHEVDADLGWGLQADGTVHTGSFLLADDGFQSKGETGHVPDRAG